MVASCRGDSMAQEDRLLAGHEKRVQIKLWIFKNIMQEMQPSVQV